MRTQIENRLSSLIGKRFSRSNRTLNLECLQFGELTKIDGGEIGEEAIHVNCAWRIVGRSLYVGSKDIDFDKEGRYDRNIDWDFETYRDILIKELIKRQDLLVTKVTADDYGGFEIHFEKGIKFQVIPTTGSMEPGNEYWRIFVPGNESEKHFVVTS
jgi:hypothetical protein